MIDPKELRIGNLVGFYKSELSDLQTGCVDEIARDEEGYVVLVPEFSRRYFSVNGLKPIPLTEEWLLKLGFTKEFDGFFTNWYGGEDHGTLFNAMLHDNGYWVIIKSASFGVEHGTNLGRSYQYVHELQNIFFALSGKQLG